MKFEFKAFTKDGKLKEGIISAGSKEEAIKILQQQELLITYIAEKKISLKAILQKPTLKDIYVFTKQLAYLLKAKNPLDESIKTLSEITPNPNLRVILMEIYDDLVSGINLSQALSRFPEIFNSYYISMVKVGESVGTLDEILDYLAEHLNNQIKLKSRIIQASIYPLIVFFLFIAVLLVLFYFIMPQIAKLFIENNIPMPFITRVFDNLAKFLLNFGIFFFIILGFLIYYFYEYFRTREGRLAFFKLAFGLPIFGPIAKNTYSAQFLESLYYLLRGGVPIVEALEIIKSSINHPLYESALDYIIEDVKKGNPLSQSLAQFPNLFSQLIVEVIKTSEKTGQLADVILTIYNFYSETLESQIANLGESLQPIFIVLLGAGLGLLEASLLIPLLNLTKYVQTF